MAIAMVLVAGGGDRAAVTQVDSRPNIIFVMTNDQDKDTVNNMPFVRDVMMPNGTTFPNATFNYPLCCPSRTSILRGQYTHNHGVWENKAAQDGGYEKFLENDLHSSIFPMWLDGAGYQTAGFGEYVNGWEPAQNGTPEGFDFFRAYNQNWTGRGVPLTEHRDTYVKDNAVRWLRENVNGPPLMMWVSFHAPHTPYQYDPKYEGRFADAVMPKGPAFNEADVSDKPEYIRNLPMLTEEQIAQAEENHRDRLRSLLTVDNALRQLRDTVQDSGELDNTYLIFWTDNGWMMGEHRLRAKRHAYVESISFPMVVRGPRVPKGTTDDRVVMNQDLAPTFAELAGASTPNFVDGRSMVPILDGTGPWRNVGLIQASPPYTAFQPPAYQGLRAEDYTYVEYATGEKEYYDLRADPYQLKNGYRALTAERKAELAAKLDALKECRGSVCRAAEDITPPQTRILHTGTGAVSVTNSTDASFSFDSSESGSRFECSMDSASFSSCSSPETFSGLTANRQHAFRVRAINKTGDVDPTPARHTWTIDTDAPGTTITGSPPGLTNDDTPTFTFSGSDNLTATADLLYSFKVDDGTWSQFSGDTNATLGGTAGLADGPHTFFVKARDPAGNEDTSPAQRSFTVDTRAPDTTITNGPSGMVNSRNATFTFASTEPGSDFECRLDGAAYSSCASSKSYTNLSDGSHTFRVRARDQAGNVDPTPETRTWVVDTIAPATTIIGGPSGPTNDDTPTFTFSGSDNLTATADLLYSFKVDDGTWSQFSGDTNATLGGTAGLADGPHTFFVKARDPAGNEDTSPAQRSFTVDTVVPDAPIINKPRENGRVTGSFIVTGTAEANSTINLFEGLDARGTATADASGSWQVPLSGITEGEHTYTARATDAAGNTSETSSARSVIVDTTAPTVVSVVPAENATGIEPVANIEVSFSEAMKAFTINESTVKLYRTRSTTPIVATVDYEAAANKAILDPSDPLVRGKQYKAVVTTRARDTAGNRLDQNTTRDGLQAKTWFFTVKR